MSGGISRRQFFKYSAIMTGMVIVIPRLFLSKSSAAVEPAIIFENPIGFNGQPKDFAMDLYHLGNGYRVYNPALGCFHQFDGEMSPFGDAGVNGYAFGANDPINQLDPSGRVNVTNVVAYIMFMLFVAVIPPLMIAAAGVASVFSVALSVVALTAGMIAGASGIAMSVIDDPSHPAYNKLAKTVRITGLIVDASFALVGWWFVFEVGALKAATSAPSLYQAWSLAGWTVKAEALYESLDAVGSSIGVAAEFKHDSTLDTIGFSINIAANVLKIGSYSRFPYNLAKDKFTGSTATKDAFGVRESHLLSPTGPNLGSYTANELAAVVVYKETVRSARVVHNITRIAGVGSPTPVVAIAQAGSFSTLSDRRNELLQDFNGSLNAIQDRQKEWKMSNKLAYGFGLGHLN